MAFGLELSSSRAVKGASCARRCSPESRSWCQTQPLEPETRNHSRGPHSHRELGRRQRMLLAAERYSICGADSATDLKATRRTHFFETGLGRRSWRDARAGRVEDVLDLALAARASAHNAKSDKARASYSPRRVQSRWHQHSSTTHLNIESSARTMRLYGSERRISLTRRSTTSRPGPSSASSRAHLKSE